MFIEIEDITNYIPDDRLSELTSDVEGVMTEVVDYANDIVEVSLRGRYKLPLNEVPISIKDVAKSIVKYKLYELKDAVTEDILFQYNNAMKILNEFAVGKKLIKDISKPNRPYSSVINKRTQKYTQEFLDLY